MEFRQQHISPQKGIHQRMWTSWRLFWSKWSGTTHSEARPSWWYIFWSGISAFLGMGSIALLSGLTHTPLVMAPFGATCVLAFGLFKSPLAQPKSIIGGHLISTLTGFVVLYTMGSTPLAMGVAVALALVLMQITRTVHAPAGADPLVVLLTNPPLYFVVAPVLLGSLILVLIALITNNLVQERRYPTYWW